MKKLLLILWLFVSIGAFSQNPDYHRYGVRTPFTKYLSYTTAQRDALTPTSTDRTIIHHLNVSPDVNTFEQWDGDSWEVLGSGSGGLPHTEILQTAYDALSTPEANDVVYLVKQKAIHTVGKTIYHGVTIGESCWIGTEAEKTVAEGVDADYFVGICWECTDCIPSSMFTFTGGLTNTSNVISWMQQVADDGEGLITYEHTIDDHALMIGDYANFQGIFIRNALGFNQISMNAENLINITSPTQIAITSDTLVSVNGYQELLLRAPELFRIITPNVDSDVATNGQVLTLIDAETGEVELTTIASGITHVNGQGLTWAIDRYNLGGAYSSVNLTGSTDAEASFSITNTGSTSNMSVTIGSGFTWGGDDGGSNTNTGYFVGGVSELYGEQIMGIGSNTSLRLRSPAIEAESASIGDVFTLIDEETGEGEWTPPSATSGTFTPVLIDTGGGATYSASTATAKLRKDDDFVYLTMFLGNITTTGSPTGNLRVTGFPDDMLSDNFSVMSVVITGSLNFNYYKVSGIMDGASSVDEMLLVYQNNLDGLESVVPATTITTGFITISGGYFIETP